MTKKDFLIQEIEKVPEDCMDEILDFVQFLQMKKRRQGSELALASEQVLGKDWLKQEEEDVWKNL